MARNLKIGRHNKKISEYELDPADIANLRIADDVIFTHKSEDEGVITCLSDYLHEDTIYSQVLGKVKVASNIYYIQNNWKDTVKYCNIQMSNARVNQDLKSVLSLLKPIDELELIWIPDLLTEPFMCKHNIHVDALKLRIFRENEIFFTSFLSAIAGVNDKRIVEGSTKGYPTILTEK